MLLPCLPIWQYRVDAAPVPDPGMSAARRVLIAQAFARQFPEAPAQTGFDRVEASQDSSASRHHPGALAYGFSVLVEAP